MIAVGDDTNRLGGAGLGYDLGSTVGLFLDTISEEDRVCNADQAVVDTVSMNVKDFAFGKVRQDGFAFAGMKRGASCGI